MNPSTRGGWKLLRETGVTADPDWLGEITDPDTLIFTVGGTTGDGVYSITFAITRKNGDPVETVVASFDRSDSETDAEIATALIADAVTELNTDRHNYLIATADNASGEGRLTLDPEFNYAITFIDPGSATITAPHTSFPITAGMPYDNHRGEGMATKLTVVVLPLDGGVEQAAGSGTWDLELIEMLPRVDRTSETVIKRAATVNDHPLRLVYSFSVSGMKRWTLRLSDPTSLPSGNDETQIWYRTERT